MKKQFTTKSYKYNWRKFEKKNMQIFLILKRMKSRQTKLVYRKERNQTNIEISPKLLVKSLM